MRKLLILLALVSLFGCRQKEPEVRNVILMIGDGMGLAHVSAAMLTADNQPLNIERATVGGFVETSSANNRVTDSAAAATALATGEKTANGFLSVDAEGNPLETILEKARRAGLATGLVATVFIEHATPAAFYAHTPNRRDYKNIAAQLSGAGVDVAIGDSENLAESTAEALVILTAKSSRRGEKGFFLMAEGSHIDTRSHENDLGAMLREMRDFDAAVGVALDWADAHLGTLVVIVADHETGGLAIPALDDDYMLPENGLDFRWSSGGHTATMVPLFAYGAQAWRFGGVMDNTEVNRKMADLLGL